MGRLWMNTMKDRNTKIKQESTIVHMYVPGRYLALEDQPDSEKPKQRRAGPHTQCGSTRLRQTIIIMCKSTIPGSS